MQEEYPTVSFTVTKIIKRSLLTVREAAEISGLSERTVRWYIEMGKLQTVKKGTKKQDRIFIIGTAFAEFMEKRTSKDNAA